MITVVAIKEEGATECDEGHKLPLVRSPFCCKLRGSAFIYLINHVNEFRNTMYTLRLPLHIIVIYVRMLKVSFTAQELNFRYGGEG